MMSEGETVYIDTRQFSERSGLPLKFVNGLLESGRLPHVMLKPSGRLLIHVEQLKRLDQILKGHKEVVEKGADS